MAVKDRNEAIKQR